MTLEEVGELRQGDEVFWNDPDDGGCSRVFKIATIEVSGDVVTITEANGSFLECFASELS